MKRCLDCGARFDDRGWRCPGCGREPGGGEIPVFAPGLAEEPGGYDPSAFAALAEIEDRNFWFRARNRLIAWALGAYFPAASRLLEIGCGTGYVLAGLARRFPGSELFGSDLHLAGLRFAAARVGPAATLFQADARRLPFEHHFDVIGAFDVIEHIVEDEAVLREMHRAVRDGGGILITVPQHRFLWSGSDEAARHVRRYRAGELCGMVAAAGFEVVRPTSFVSLLFPAMVASRLAGRLRRDRDPMAEFRIPRWLNAALERILGVERWLIENGVNFPFGGSLLVVARKRPIPVDRGESQAHKASSAAGHR